MSAAIALATRRARIKVIIDVVMPTDLVEQFHDPRQSYFMKPAMNIAARLDAGFALENARGSDLVLFLCA